MLRSCSAAAGSASQMDRTFGPSTPLGMGHMDSQLNTEAVLTLVPPAAAVAVSYPPSLRHRARALVIRALWREFLLPRGALRDGLVRSAPRESKSGSV